MLDAALGARRVAEADPLPTVSLRLLALRVAVEAVGAEGFARSAAALDAIEMLLADAREGYRSLDDVRRMVRALSRR